MATQPADAVKIWPANPDDPWTAARGYSHCVTVEGVERRYWFKTKAAATRFVSLAYPDSQVTRETVFAALVLS